MTRTIYFSQLARVEFENAAAWYEEQGVGLEDAFRLEVDAVLQRVLKSPEQFRLISRSTRKIPLQRFHKYSIYYSVEPSAINVISVFHASRNPNKLRWRLK